jgi:biopolymer transport protein ExbD
MHGGEAEGELPVNVTPIIDIIFCLVLFFMASYAPRSQKGELSTYLPKDKGINPTALPPELESQKEEISIYINYIPSENKSRYSVDNSEPKDLRGVVNTVLGRIKDLPSDKIPPIRLRPKKNVPWDAVTAIMSELRKASSKIKEIELGTAQE